MSNLAVFKETLKSTPIQARLDEVLKDNKESFVASLTSIVSSNKQLALCEPKTIIQAAIKAVTLKLPIDQNLGFAYVIPYKNKGNDEAQFQIGYKGFIQLAMRSGQFQTINADAVYEGEVSKRDKRSGDIELNGTKKSDKVEGYFAYFKLLNGFEKTIYMSVDEVKAHAMRFSQSAKRGYGLWAEKDSFDAMAKKTLLKMLLSKYAPLSIDMQSAIKADQAIYRDEDMRETYADNEPQVDEQMAEEIVKKSRKNRKKVEDAMEQKPIEVVAEVAPDPDEEPEEDYEEPIDIPETELFNE